MADAVLGATLDHEVRTAIASLLARPLCHVDDDIDTFRLIARHRDRLTTWFHDTCGWVLTVDIASGVARLGKHRRDPDATRPLTTGRGKDVAFDPRRYQLLCLIASELVKRPMTTTGLLAQAVAAGTDFRTEKYRDRVAFVDALRALVRWHAVTVTSGDVEAFVDEDGANALLSADATVLHRLLTSPVAPSRLDTATVTDAATAVRALTATTEIDDDGAGREERNRRIRQHLARRLLDDPVVHFDDCTDDERVYLASGAGRQWLRDRATDAGFTLEERLEGLLVVDGSAATTDIAFPAPAGTVHQMALLLVDEFIAVDTGTGRRVTATKSEAQVHTAVRRRLDSHPKWAKAFQEPGGERHLARRALDLLSSLGLVRRDGDSWYGRPAICRYRVDTGAML